MYVTFVYVVCFVFFFLSFFFLVRALFSVSAWQPCEWGGVSRGTGLAVTVSPFGALGLSCFFFFLKRKSWRVWYLNVLCVFVAVVFRIWMWSLVSVFFFCVSSAMCMSVGLSRQ